MARLITICIIATALVAALSMFNSLCTSQSKKELESINTGLAAGSFEQWKQTNKKMYLTPSENNFRIKVFSKNANTLASMKSQDLGYETHIGKFADLTDEEFLVKYTGLMQANFPEEMYEETRQLLNSMTKEKPRSLGNSEIDWEREGKLGRVRNQNQCGSCYSFASALSLQALFAKNNRLSEVLEFSEQNIVDCTKPYGNNGCGGGLNEVSFTFAADYGVMPRSMYPYTGEHDGSCKHDTKKAIKANTRVGIIKLNPQQMIQGLGFAPLAVGMDSAGIKYYKHGIIPPTISTCTPNPNHAVVIFGMGSYDNGKPYWRVRNSWGADWGENGNFRIHADMEGPGVCGINKQVSLPM